MYTITFDIMKTNPQLKNVADVISVLMMSEQPKFDMETVQVCAEAEMDRVGVSYKPYMQVLEGNDEEGYLQTRFDDTNEYLFDAINCNAITDYTIYRIVELCMEVR